MKNGNKKSFRKLLSVVGELDGCLAEDWASAITSARKEAPEIFYLGLQSEESPREFVLYTAVHEWWGYYSDEPEMFQTLDQLIEKYKSDQKKLSFLQWCRDYMKDLAKKGFEE